MNTIGCFHASEFRVHGHSWKNKPNSLQAGAAQQNVKHVKLLLLEAGAPRVEIAGTNHRVLKQSAQMP